MIQLDEHFDWRDEVGRVTLGLSSPMKRASELEWVSGMAQIGLRAVGSAHHQEVDDARNYGNVLMTAWEPHCDGAEVALARILDGQRYYTPSMRMRSALRLLRVLARLTLNFIGALAHAGQIGR